MEHDVSNIKSKLIDDAMLDGKTLLWSAGKLSIVSREDAPFVVGAFWRVWSDASWLPEVNRATAGGWVATPDGRHVSTLVANIPDDSGFQRSSFGAEAFALSQAGELALASGADSARFRFDCLPLAKRIVAALKGDRPGDVENEAIRASLSKFGAVALEWVGRQRNALADRISRIPLGGGERQYAIKSISLNDMMDDPVGKADLDMAMQYNQMSTPSCETVKKKSQNGCDVLLGTGLGKSGKSANAVLSFFKTSTNGAVILTRHSKRHVANCKIESDYMNAAQTSALFALRRTLRKLGGCGISTLAICCPTDENFIARVREVVGNTTNIVLPGTESPLALAAREMSSPSSVAVTYKSQMERETAKRRVANEPDDHPQQKHHPHP